MATREVIPILMHFSSLQVVALQAHKAARHTTRCDVIDDVNLFSTVYRRVYFCNFLTLSNQTSRVTKESALEFSTSTTTSLLLFTTTAYLLLLLLLLLLYYYYFTTTIYYYCYYLYTTTTSSILLLLIYYHY